MKVVFLHIIFLVVCFSSFAQTDRQHIREGNKLYQKEKFEEASEEYNKALNKNNASEKANFNLADALYKQEKYADAAQKFQQIAESTSDNELKANAYHNQGNALLKSEKLEESIDSYKKSLRINPNDNETRHNLSYAKQKLVQQQQQQNKDNKSKDNKDDKNQDKKDSDNKDKGDNKDKNDQKKDKEKSDENKDKSDEKSDQEKSQEDKEEQEKKEGSENEKSKDEKKEEQKPKPNQISQQDTQRMLDALQNEEKKLQLKLQQKKGKPINKTKIEKDW